jgi:hypothetical protein
LLHDFGAIVPYEDSIISAIREVTAIGTQDRFIGTGRIWNCWRRDGFQNRSIKMLEMNGAWRWPNEHDVTPVTA